MVIENKNLAYSVRVCDSEVPALEDVASPACQAALRCNQLSGWERRAASDGGKPHWVAEFLTDKRAHKKADRTTREAVKVAVDA